MTRSRTRSWAIILALLIATPVVASPPGARLGARTRIPHAQDLGATSTSRVLNISVWLRMHDSALLDQTVRAQQDPSSAAYQLWTDPGLLEARHSPSAGEVGVVRSYLTARGLTVTGVGPQNLYVSARGTVAQVQRALGVQLHDYRLGSSTFFASTTKPALAANVRPFVAYVGGLSDMRPHPMNVRPVEPDGTGTPRIAVQPDGLLFSPSCFRPAQTVKLKSADGTVKATYFGNRYGQDIDSGPPNLPPCGYQPSDIQDAYNLDNLYKRGLDGTGQTVAIVDAFGSITLEEDVALFSAAMGLPPADITVIGTPTESDYSGTPNAGWADETTLDVEWVHAIAPGAKIVLVVTEDNSFENLIGGNITAASVPGVTAISNSWGNIELATFPELRQIVDDIFRSITAKGISIHFSSGDAGDEAIDLGVADVDWPASSPLVTAVGGVSLALDKNQEVQFQTAWGNNITQIADVAPDSEPLDPVNNEGFIFGGGGGVSDVYAKPAFQKKLSGLRRTVPDISWLADPFTGVEIIITGDPAGDQFVEVIGGTSLACPMFSGLWAIASQRAGHKLGQAAASLYSLPISAITDVRAANSLANVNGAITDPDGTFPEIASDLAAPLQNLPSFFSALFQGGSSRWYVLTFGTNSTLAATDGYDLATGLGTPWPPDFIDAVARLHH